MNFRLASAVKHFGQIRHASAVAASAQEVLAAGNQAAISELSNGFRVTSVENNRHVSTIGLWLDLGSIYDDAHLNGSSAFVEQLVYHGSGGKAQLELELAKLGGRLSSYTSREHTAFFVQVPNAGVEKAVALLANAVKNPSLDNSAVEAERNVLLRKLAESESNLSEVALDNLHATAFQGTPFAQSPLGNTNGLTNISRDDIQSFLKNHLQPTRIVLAGVGGVNHERLAALGEQHFGSLTNNYERKIPQYENVRFTGSEFIYRDDSVPYIHGAIAVEGVSQNNPDALPLLVASTIVGGWSNTSNVNVNAPSTLVQKLSILPALKSYQSFSINYNNTGLFGFQWVSTADDQADVMEITGLIQRQWKSLATSVTNDEIDRAKNLLKSEVLAVADDSTRFADRIARDVLNTGAPVQLADLDKAIQKIDSGSIREAVSRNVYDRDVAVATVGRTEATPLYAAVRYGQSWWRL
uniref:Cytochrome b-c1 complex subunit 2, mitochondrial n=1 Tax=Panagrellus redivivus TaxID=6233 RepID=A0A7E4UV16_PANRE